MSYVMRRSIIIRVPPEQVFDELLDLPGHMEWGDMDQMEILDEGPVQVGTRWTSSGETSNIKMKDQCQIVALERPRLFSFRSHSQSNMGAAVVTLSYELEPAPEGTKVTFSRVYDYDAVDGFAKMLFSIPGFKNVIAPAIDKFTAVPAVDQGLVRLRDRVESRPA